MAERQGCAHLVWILLDSQCGHSQHGADPRNGMVPSSFLDTDTTYAEKTSIAFLLSIFPNDEEGERQALCSPGTGCPPGLGHIREK